MLRYPEPLCCPAACHPPNPDTTWTHRSSDTFLVPTDGTSLPSTGSHPAQTHSVVTGRVTLCHPTARWDQRGPHNPRTQKRTAPSPAWHGTQHRTAAATEMHGDTAHAWPATVPSMSPDLEKQHPAALEGFANNEQPQLPLLAPAPGQALPQQTLVINNISRHLPAALPARRTRCHLPSPKPRRCSPAPATHCDPAQAACSAEGHTAQPAQGIHSCLRGEETARRGSAGAAGMSRSPGEQRRDSHELFLALNDGRMLSPDPPCSTHSGHAPEQQLGSRSLEVNKGRLLWRHRSRQHQWLCKTSYMTSPTHAPALLSATQIRRLLGVCGHFNSVFNSCLQEVGGSEEFYGASVSLSSFLQAHRSHRTARTP